MLRPYNRRECQDSVCVVLAARTARSTLSIPCLYKIRVVGPERITFVHISRQNSGHFQHNVNLLRTRPRHIQGLT